MSWDERQRGMLAAMGLRVWERPVGESALLESSLDQAALTTAVEAAPATPVMAAHEDSNEHMAHAANSADSPSPVSVVQALPPELRRASTAPAPATAPQMQEGLDAERLPAIAAMDWLTLRHSVGDCRACMLCEGRRAASDAVFGRGQPQAPWLVVGDAPGEQEVGEGQPFGGQAGQLLGNMLRAVGLDPAESAGQVAIVNALKCRPTPGRNPGAHELLQCEPYLQRQIELVQPRVILALGRMAVQSLLHTQEALGRLRGRVHRYQQIPVIVSFPPSYLLRNPAEKARAWADLCLARQSLQDRGAHE
ncbi:uracil-DNA glycosylase [Paucibacter sp. AS339]|uniref:uracil-DNA glycosylase n=1 Tax=Paucibacter hankyongi TaxID=3133434 RepID=UPI00309CC54A